MQSNTKSTRPTNTNTSGLTENLLHLRLNSESKPGMMLTSLCHQSVNSIQKCMKSVSVYIFKKVAFIILMNIFLLLYNNTYCFYRIINMNFTFKVFFQFYMVKWIPYNLHIVKHWNEYCQYTFNPYLRVATSLKFSFWNLKALYFILKWLQDIVFASLPLILAKKNTHHPPLGVG